MATSTSTPRGKPDRLAQYEAIWLQSRQMLETARRGDWDALIELERRRATINGALINEARENGRAHVDQERLRQLILDILASDEETRLLVEPRRNELRNLVGSINTERKLLKAYAMDA